MRRSWIATNRGRNFHNRRVSVQLPGPSAGPRRFSQCSHELVGTEVRTSTRRSSSSDSMFGGRALYCRKVGIATGIVDASSCGRFQDAAAFTGIDRGLLRSVLGPWSPVPKCDAPRAPISVEEHTSMASRPRAKVRILRFKNLPPFRHDRGLQNHV